MDIGSWYAFYFAMFGTVVAFVLIRRRYSRTLGVVEGVPLLAAGGPTRVALPPLSGTAARVSMIYRWYRFPGFLVVYWASKAGGMSSNGLFVQWGLYFAAYCAYLYFTSEGLRVYAAFSAGLALVASVYILVPPSYWVFDFPPLVLLLFLVPLHILVGSIWDHSLIVGTFHPLPEEPSETVVPTGSLELTAAPIWTGLDSGAPAQTYRPTGDTEHEE
jgi:hypothetical protein